MKRRIENGQQFIFKGETDLSLKSENHEAALEGKLVTIKIVES